MSNFAQRVVTALVGAAVTAAALWVGEWAFTAFVGLVAVAAQRELYVMLRAAGTAPLVGYGLALGAVAAVWPVVPRAGLVLAGGLLALLPLVLFLRRETPLLDAAGTAFGVLYPAALASSLLLLRLSDAGWLAGDDAFWLTLAVLICVWGADSFAYLAGRAFGRTPLFERVSPKKTWEGAIGGAVGAFALAGAFKATVLADALGWLDVGVIAVACGLLSPLGDLAESLFKRSVGVKDSAAWLPGHGGLMDRIDATVVAVPVIALYFEATRGLL